MAGPEPFKGEVVERSDSDLVLTSSEAAELLGVHASTVKRWCNEGALGFHTTAGGHRRFSLQDVVDLAASREIETILTPFHPYESHVWKALKDVRERGSFRAFHSLALGWVHRGHVGRVGRLYDALARVPEVGLCTFCDEGVRGLMSEVGNAWEAGRLRVGEEHLVSQILLETLIRLRTERREGQPLSDTAEGMPVAVVGTLEGNLHHMGSMCVRILLEAMGWKVHYLGPDVPLEDFAVVQRGREADLLCISLTPPATAGDVRRAVQTLTRFYDPSRPYALAFGGQVFGEVPPELLEGPFRASGVFSGCHEFQKAVRNEFAPMAQEVLV